MMISRLRKPISKSITTVLCPRSARPEEIAAEEVVFPTPPFPDVITIILAKTEPFLVISIQLDIIYPVYPLLNKEFKPYHKYKSFSLLIL